MNSVGDWGGHSLPPDRPSRESTVETVASDPVGGGRGSPHALAEPPPEMDARG